jgi:predicted molibdopterin-dependent oxidoreductase YjgC
MGTMNQINRITINGRDFIFRDNETIYEIATRHNIYIPTLCYLKNTTPTGACRICIVEVENLKNLVPACSTPAASGMIVSTDSPAVIEARRQIIALMLASGNHSCAISGKNTSDWLDFQIKVLEYENSDDVCPAIGECRLQELAYKYQVAEMVSDLSPETFVPKYTIEEVNPFIVRDFSRCILCGRCVSACNELQGNNAISIGYRGASAKIVTRGDNSLIDSDCVFCGECLQVCPVGALLEKNTYKKYKPWDLKRVQSTCTYCGTGCSIDIFVKDGKVVKVSGTEDGPVNFGSLCVKGRFGNDFIHSPERLTKPLIRVGDSFKEAEWDEAMDYISRKLSEIKAKDGPDSIAGLSSARCTNEDNYIMQKFMRAVIGTNNIDHCARL